MPPPRGQSVTHVSGIKCHPCLRKHSLYQSGISNPRRVIIDSRPPRPSGASDSRVLVLHTPEPMTVGLGPYLGAEFEVAYVGAGSRDPGGFLATFILLCWLWNCNGIAPCPCPLESN